MGRNIVPQLPRRKVRVENECRIYLADMLSKANLLWANNHARLRVILMKRKF